MNRIALAYARFLAAFTFLTRLPLPGVKRLEFTKDTVRKSLFWYPTVGLFFGVLSLGCFMAGCAVQLDPTLTAFGLLVLPYLLNRFLHFDGLCDVLDGFLADRSPAERLAIMKDSRNGSFAMGGAILFLLGKYLVLLNLVELGFSSLAVVLLAPVVSRWILVTMAFRSEYPRERGTGQAIVGQVSLRNLVSTTAGFLSILLVGFIAGTALDDPDILFTANARVITLIVAVVIGLACSLSWMFGLRQLSQRKIGGVTGDVLGCLSESSELVFLFAAFMTLHIAV